MTKAGAFLLGFASAAAAAGGAWFVFAAPKWSDFEARTAAAERVSQRAKRDASEFQEYAETERRRKADLEEENATLKKQLAAGPPAAMPSHLQPKAEDPLKPELWDRKRIGQE